VFLPHILEYLYKATQYVNLTSKTRTLLPNMFHSFACHMFQSFRLPILNYYCIINMLNIIKGALRSTVCIKCTNIYYQNYSIHILLNPHPLPTKSHHFTGNIRNIVAANTLSIIWYIENVKLLNSLLYRF